MRTLITLHLLLVTLAGLAAGQVQSGDLLLGDCSGDFGGVVHRKSDGTFVELAADSRGPVNALTMAADNATLVALTRGDTDLALVFDPSLGTFSSLADLADYGSPSGVVLDQDGSFVLASAYLDQLDRLAAGGALTSMAALTGVVNAVALDLESGDFLVGLYETGDLLAVDRAGNMKDSIAAGLGRISGIACDPATGNIIVTTYDAPQIRLIDRSNGSVIKSATFEGANALKLDSVSRLLHVCGLDRVATYASDLSARLADHTFEDHTFTAVEVHGSRKLTGNGAAARGSLYRVDLSFPSSENGMYAAALSTGLRPGLALGGEMVNLDVTSPLFYASLAGVLDYMLPGRVGTLNGISASLHVQIPQEWPAGFRFFLGAVAIKDGRFEVGNALGITIE